MKHHYETILAVALCALSFSAQADVVYEPMIVASGFNRDCIAESTRIGYNDGSAWSPLYDLTSASKHTSCFATQSVIRAINADDNFSDEEYAKTIAGGWPEDNGNPDDRVIRCSSEYNADAINNPTFANLYWRLAPYDGPNVLTLRPGNPDSDTKGWQASGTLTFQTIGCYDQLFFLMASLRQGSGVGQRKVTTVVHYTDGTTSNQEFLFAGLGGEVGQRVQVTNIYEDGIFKKNTARDGNVAYVSVFQMDVTSTKLIESIEFTNNITNTAAIIFAVTGRTADIEIPDEEEAVTSAITENSFTISWDEVGEAETYRVDVATDEDFQHMVGDYNNLEVSKNDTVVYGLDEDTDYYWRVRSVNAAGGQSASSAPRRARTAGINPPQTRETDDDIEEQLAPYVGYRATLAELDIHRTFYRDGYFNTICLPFSLSQEYIDTCAHFTNSRIFAFTSAAQNGDQLDLVIDPVTSIDAGIPYLIKWADYGDVIPSPLKFYNVNITTNKGDSVGDPDGIRFVGHIGMQQIELNKDYNLFVGGNDMLYWPDNTNSKMKGFRAYFALPHELPSGAPIHRGMAARLVEQNNAPTGMEEQQTESYSQKMLRDGQVIIIRNGKTYNILGGLIR